MGVAGVKEAPNRRSGFKLDLSTRGYQVLFRPNEANHCPGCGRAQWYVGRITAECVFCQTALPLADAHWGDSGGRERKFVPVTGSRSFSGSVDWAERRRDERRPGEGRTVNLLINGSPQAFAIYNISRGGLMIDAPTGLIGARSVEIVAPDGETVAATIQWTEGGQAGLQLARPLSLGGVEPATE
jgi:hypothetical protein